MNANDLVLFLKNIPTNPYNIHKKNNVYEMNVNDITLKINVDTNVFEVPGINYDRSTIFDLTKKENHSVFMLILKLFKKGYSLSSITLEKSWQTGHDPIYLDVMLKNPLNNDIFMFEVKTPGEYKKYTNPNEKRKINQLFSYAMQEYNTYLVSFYTYDFSEKKDYFSNVFCRDIRQVAQNTEDFYERWNKIFNNDDYIFSNPVFNISKNVLKHTDLVHLTDDDTKIIYNQFLTILRLNSISDKPNAFMKMINLFLAKIADELTEDKTFYITGKNGNKIIFSGMKFQYIEGIDTPESFMKRLNELYKEGMKQYLNKDIVDYTDQQIDTALHGEDNAVILKIINDLRLKRNNNFSYIEVYDDETFLENYAVVKDIVKLIETYKLKYETKHQFLGDFFEELLNTSLKQEAGQFFTPYPLVDFMIDSLDFEANIKKKLEERTVDYIPNVIDFACGAGHFLISSMNKIQNILQNLNESNLTESQKRDLLTYKSNPYSWVNNKVVGIEKDYRLAKTTKIATFLNGDGKAEIIAGDGINKFDSKEYQNTILYTSQSKNEKFDYVVSNPPYSVKGFMLNFIKNNINSNSNTFTLLDSDLSVTEATIEIYFVERMEQLLKADGIGAIVLPQSILTSNKYNKMRKFIFTKFKLVSMLLTADITFSGTTTSPVILFLRKAKDPISDYNYDILVIKSPKYDNPTSSKMRTKETKFIGYKFSTNRATSGITVIKNSILKEITKLNRKMINSENFLIPDNLKEYCSIKKLNSIIFNSGPDDIGQLYPRSIELRGIPLNEVCKINSRRDTDFRILPDKYLEISELGTQIPSKQLRSSRYCKEGDILVTSLNPVADKIVIAKGEFMLTTAIHVLSFEDDDIRDKVYSQLKTKSVLKQMNAFTEGFKVTYAKISDYNLYNNIHIDLNE